MNRIDGSVVLERAPWQMVEIFAHRLDKMDARCHRGTEDTFPKSSTKFPRYRTRVKDIQEPVLHEDHIGRQNELGYSNSRNRNDRIMTQFSPMDIEVIERGRASPTGVLGQHVSLAPSEEACADPPPPQ